MPNLSPWAADLHIHSHYSRATAPDLEPAKLAFWAARKGLELIGSGDLTHPGWLEELRRSLAPAPEEGLFVLAGVSGAEAQVRFLLSGEVSCIYKKDGQVRKVHLVILMPSFQAAERFNARLAAVGNLASDGRPILGLDARRILEASLEADPLAEVIPAHIWTPWFSVLGSKSGFDCLADCFEDLTSHIHAVETGLSSDPAMNWRVCFLDSFFLTSSSDAHSPANLGREATLFEAELSYPALIAALRSGQGLAGTIEFFPEEGKYHLDGHRACRVRLEPEETARLGGLCPVCGRPVTVGVLNRVEALADRPKGDRPASARPYFSLLGLHQVLGEAMETGPGSKRVGLLYEKLLANLGPELFILLKAPLEEIERLAGPLVAEGIARVRRGQVRAEAGFDGQFGRMSLFTPEERAEILRQGHLFGFSQAVEHKRQAEWLAQPLLFTEAAADPLAELIADAEQEKAISAPAGPLLILAGPGSGKTRVLTLRIARLLKLGASPERILALTFTRQASGELASRLVRLAGASASQVRVMTCHSLGLEILRSWGDGREVVPEEERERLIRPLARKAGLRPGRAGELIARAKLALNWREAICPADLLVDYQAVLEAEGVLDYEDLIALPLRLAAADPDRRGHLASLFEHVLVDEFQDLNPVQYAWLGLLAPEPERSLTVVGDPDQAIYGFRGASPRFFERLAKDRPGLQVIGLATSYRCPGPHLAAAAAAIKPNPGRHLDLKPARPGGGKLRLAVCPSPAAEAYLVCQEIERLLGGSSHLAQASQRLDAAGGYGLAEMAILFRLHRQAEELAQALDKAGLPYQIAGTAPTRETDELSLGAEKISLLTFHAAKGLEFPVVFLTGLEERLLPHQPPEGPIDWEEERRLFYVGLTRARDSLILTRSEKRTHLGQTLRPRPSPFLADLPAELVETTQATRFKPRRPVQMELF